MEFFENTKKVVACPADHRIAIDGFTDRFGGKLCAGPFYLYLVLMKGRRKQIETLIVITVCLLLLARWQKKADYAFAGLAILLLGILWKPFAETLRIAWAKLGEGLGFVFGKILLSLVFFLVLLPLATFAKAFGKLNIRLKPGEGSYFKERNHHYVKEDFEQPW